MAEESLNFKFSLDLSDFDKAPKIIDDALQHIASQAEAQGKNADMAMAKWVQDMIKERESRVAELTKQIEDATRAYAETFANFQNGNATYEDWEKSYEALNKLKDELSQTKDELNLLNEKENEVAGNASFLTQLKMKAQGIDLYGKAMSMLPAPIANVIKSTSSLNKALLALTTNPIVMMLAGLAVAIKGLYGWFDGLADRSDGVAYAFGVVTGAVDKVISAFNELIHLNVEGFLYNIKTMFDGGEREVAKRNEDLRRVEEQGLRDRLQRDNQFLRRRMSNTKLDMKDRLEAEKQYTENLKTIEETRRKQLERQMTEWSKKNGLRTAENPEGWATDISQLSGPLQVELQEMYNEMARIDNAMADITEESKDRLVKMREQVHSEFEANMKWLDDQVKARKQYQRQVREALEQEKERLRTMALQTENAVIQSQINDMADGIEKVTKQAGLKAKQAMEALDREVRAEAEKLYSNEKSLFEANPANEGKMFKAFKLDDYIAQARKNVGDGIRKELISNEEIATIKKAADDVANKALEGAKKVSEEVHKTFTELTKMLGVEAPSFMDSYDKFTTGIDDAIRATTSFKNITDEIEESQRRVLNLQMERLRLEMQINNTSDPEEMVELAQQLEEANISINIELERGEILLSEQRRAGEKVKAAYDKIKNNVSQIVGSMSDIAEEFKGISDAGDDMVDAMQQMMGFLEKIIQGDWVGAILQVVVTIGKGIANIVKELKHEGEMSDEAYEKMVKIGEATALLIDASERYKLNLIGAKEEQDALYDTTRIKAMIDAQNKLTDLQKSYNAYLDNMTSSNNSPRHRKSALGIENFVDNVNSVQIDLTPHNEFRKTYQSLGDFVKKRFGDDLFMLEGNEYRLNTDIWEQIKKDQNTLVLFDDSMIKQMDMMVEYQNKIAETSDEQAQSMADWYSPLLDNMTDVWMDWLNTGEDVMDSFRDYAGDSFRQIIKDQLKSNIYQQVFKPYVDSITKKTADALKGGTLDDSFAETLAKETQDLMNDFERQSKSYKKFLESYDEVLNNLSINIKEDSAGGRSAEARGIARASQESVDENNARLAMMQQHTYTINANVAQLVSYSASALEHLSAIHSNTNRLERIEGILSDINTYGVRTR